MSDFDNLERDHAAAMADLIAVLDIAGGVDDVLQHLDRAQALDAVSDVLDLRSGAAAALDAAGIENHPVGLDDDRRAPSMEEELDRLPRLSPDSMYADSVEPDQDRSFPMGSIDGVLDRIRRLYELLDELKSVLAIDNAHAPTLPKAQSCLDKLAARLKERSISQEVADDMVSEVRILVVVRIAKEIQASGYGPRLNAVEHHISGLRASIARLFDPSEHFEYSQLDL